MQPQTWKEVEKLLDNLPKMKVKERNKATAKIMRFLYSKTKVFYGQTDLEETSPEVYEKAQRFTRFRRLCSLCKKFPGFYRKRKV